MAVRPRPFTEKSKSRASGGIKRSWFAVPFGVLFVSTLRHRANETEASSIPRGRLQTVTVKLRRSRPSFVNYVEWRFRCSPETSEPGRSHHLSDTCFAGLRAEAESHLLGP
jgi:hypothetical protein